MRACPTCKQPGLYEHSVLIAWQEAAREPSPAELTTYLRCARCGQPFQCTRSTLTPLDPTAFEALGTMLWIRPPWVEVSLEAEFEFSWDFTHYFYVRLDLPEGELFSRLLERWRGEGYGARLRAGQSVTMLMLSRSREHGLREEQSYLQLAASDDGTLYVTGVIDGRRVQGDAISPEAGWLSARLDELGEVEVS